MNKLLYLIQVDEVNYLIDKDAEIKVGSKCKSNGKIVTVLKVLHDDNYEVDGLPRFVSNISKPVIAVEYSHKIDGLYQYKLPDEDDIQKLADDYGAFWAGNNGTWDGSEDEAEEYQEEKDKYSQAFYEGYKANKAKWTDAQMENAIKMAQEKCIIDLRTEERDLRYTPEEVLQSLNKPKEVESVEVEMVKSYRSTGLDTGIPSRDQKENGYKPKLDKEGLLVISKINWK